MPFANYCNVLLRILLVLGLLSGCRSERVAFDFHSLPNNGARRIIVDRGGANNAPTLGVATSRITVEELNTPLKCCQRIDSLAADERQRKPAFTAAAQFKASSPAARTRKQGNVIRCRLHALRAASARALAKHSQQVARRGPAEHEISGGAILIIIALLALGFALFFVGIPLLIAAEFSLGFWTALAWWLGLIVAFIFLLFIREIIDTIGDLFRPRQ